MPDSTSLTSLEEQLNSQQSAYTQAGVNVSLGNELKAGIGARVKKTHGPEVLGSIGGFGGLFQPNFQERQLKNPVLVSSVDGVGTKLKIAFAANKHQTIGADLVNHCVNDIAVTGARPLFFLDYIATANLEKEVIDQLLQGLSNACEEASCALIGGETAQMPGLYHPHEYDLAGTIVGVVDRENLLDGTLVEEGDLLLGLPSHGLHTNGYTLARHVLFEKMNLSLSDRPKELGLSLEEELLKIHRSYLPEFKYLDQLPQGTLHAAAHITGGGLIDNLPRVLSHQWDAIIQTHSWSIPSIFKMICHGGAIDPLEMYRVFNMGIGMVLILAPQRARELSLLWNAPIIGHIQKGVGQVHLYPSSELS